MTSGGSLSALRKLAQPRTDPPARSGQPAEAERCEMCTAPIVDMHGHVADLQGHRLMCTCRPCYLLFSSDGAAPGRYRAVPDRYRAVRDLVLDSAGWDTLQIPVDLAFFYYATETETQVAFYPGPGGATESQLGLEGWERILADNSVMGDLYPDVEAVLLRRDGRDFECFMVPIDACYELVGLVRLSWTGFSGGAKVWADIEAFYDRLRDRSRDVRSGG